LLALRNGAAQQKSVVALEREAEDGVKVGGANGYNVEGLEGEREVKRKRQN